MPTKGYRTTAARRAMLAERQKMCPTQGLETRAVIELGRVKGATFKEGVNAILTDLLRRNTANELRSLVILAIDVNGNKLQVNEC